VKLVTRLVLVLLASSYLHANSNCEVPPRLQPFILQKPLKAFVYIADIRRNYKQLQGLCTHVVAFNEGRINWKMLLVSNPKASHGLFYFLPHDNENSAFATALYAVRHYGGGFLSVITGDKRYNHGQDPNRNFSYSSSRICKEQIAPSPLYTTLVFSTIDYYKNPTLPYIALHNNTNRGGISALKSSTKTKSYLAYPLKQVKRGVGLADEDSIIYITGSSPTPPQNRLSALLQAGLNVKYERVNSANNDCSMSNFVVLEKGTTNYYNIEAQHGKTTTQIEMLIRLIKIIQ
jgi:hypothetical protein